MTPHSDRYWNSTHVHIGVYLCKLDLPALETKHRLWLIGTLDTLAWANWGNTPYQRTNVIDAVVGVDVDVCSRVTSSNNKQILITSCKEDYPCVTQPHVWLVHLDKLSTGDTHIVHLCVLDATMNAWLTGRTSLHLSTDINLNRHLIPGTPVQDISTGTRISLQHTQFGINANLMPWGYCRHLTIVG